MRQTERPRGGWLRSVRQGLGMTLDEFARRMGCSRTAAAHVEKSEARDRITLARLRSAADALGCDLHVSLTPRRPLAEMARNQAMKQAAKLLSRAGHSMSLEDQALSDEEVQAIIQLEADRILLTGRIEWN